MSLSPVGLVVALALPATAYSSLVAIDNPWSVVTNRAAQAGKQLAEVLLSRHQVRIRGQTEAMTSVAPWSWPWCPSFKCFPLTLRIFTGSALDIFQYLYANASLEFC